MPPAQHLTPAVASRNTKPTSPWAHRVTAFRTATDSRGTDMTLLAAVQYAVGEAQRGTIQAIRRARQLAKEKAKAQGLDERESKRMLKKSTDTLKRGLWGFIPTGVYTGGRQAEHAKARSECVMVEADAMGVRAAKEAVQTLSHDKHIMAAWVSPSGDGIKILLWVQGGDNHRQRHAYASKHVFGTGGPLDGVQDDTCYRNEHLLCFGSYDPDAHVRTGTLTPLVVPHEWISPEEKQQERKKQAEEKKATKESDHDQMMDTADLCKVLAHIPPDCRFNPDMTEREEGQARDQWLRIGMAIHSTMPTKAGRDVWDRWSSGKLGTNAILGEEPDNYDSRALRASWHSFKDMDTEDGEGVTWATAVHLGRQWERAEAARGALTNNQPVAPEDAEDDELGENADRLEVAHFLVRAYYSQPTVKVLATGERMDNSGPPEMAAKRIAVEMRTKFKMDVSTGMVQDAVDVECAVRAALRRGILVDDVVGADKGTEAGKAQVRKWLIAVTGKVDALDEAVVLHVLRNVKLKLLGQGADDHKSLILYQLQRSGKSTAIERLVSPLEDLVYHETSLKKMVDERGLRRFGRYAAIIWDEMAGARGRDVDEHIDTLKALVTSTKVTVRPMGTNTDISFVNTATLFGSTNRPVAEVIKDPTGNRRFWEITTLPLIDWAGVNKVDYKTLWSAIGVKDKSPLANQAMDAAVMKRHMDTRYKDTVEQWAEAGEWGALVDVRRPGSPVLCDLPTVEGGKWYATADLFARFLVWCSQKGFNSQANQVWFGRRLKSLGWASHRIRVKGFLEHGYEAPITL